MGILNKLKDLNIGNVDNLLFSNTNNDFEEELKNCQQYAKEGYKLADSQYNEILKTLRNESSKIKDASQRQNAISRVKNTKLMNQQQIALNKMANYIDKIHNDIQMLHNNQKEFTIIVYGRTMAGKSTLMEILTHGNGKSIGKGAQRTTRDVRSYYWKGLKIYDVPGICSFDGAEDDKLAFEAAKSADLILFLLTDNAPEADEAEALAQLKGLGKPVLGIINVKMAFNINDKDLDLPDLQDKLADTRRIDNICAQFKEFAKLHGQNWDDIPFISTHLNAAFQAQPERGDDIEVYQISNFPKVEKYILDKVRADGKFLRMKNFINIVAVPMQNIIAAIYEHSANTLEEGRLYEDKIKELASWRKEFIEMARKKFANFHDDLNAQIDREIYRFVEYNYENKDASQVWETVVNKLDFPAQCQAFLQSLSADCERKRKKLSDELTQEIKFTFSGRAKANVKVESITDTKTIAQAVAIPIATGIGYFLTGGLGVVVGIGLGVLPAELFDSKEAKIKKAKAKMREDLTELSHKMIDDICNKAVGSFQNEILKKGIDKFGNLLLDMSYLLINLGAAQCKLANKLNKTFRTLNAKLLQEAIKYKGKQGGKVYIKDIARVPGKEFLIIAHGQAFNDRELSTLLDESVQIVAPENNDAEMVEKILDSGVKTIEFKLDGFDESKKAWLLIPTGDTDRTDLLLAQQVAGIPIEEKNYNYNSKANVKKYYDSDDTNRSISKNHQNESTDNQEEYISNRYAEKLKLEI